MSTSLTAEGRDLLSRHLLGDSATTFPGVGQCWVSLHSAQPGNAGSWQISASRVQVAMSYDSTNKWFTNASAVSIPSVSGSIQWVALWHGAGTGFVWFEGQLPSPVGISGSHSVIIPANALKIYATPPDGSNKGGIAERGFELVAGHFLGVSSWTMPTSFYMRTHSANAGVTGNGSLASTLSPALSKSMEYDHTNTFRGVAYFAPGYSGNSRYWSTTDASGNALCWGECASGEQAWANYFGDGGAVNRVDASGADDSTAPYSGHTFTFTSLRVSFDVASGIVNGDVNSGTMTAATVAAGSLIASLRATLNAATTSVIALISVGSTSVAVGTAHCICNAQIGDSAPGSGFSVEGLLYESLVTLQVL